MKKTLTFIVMLIITLALAIPAFAHGGETEPIYPWLIPVDEDGNRIITVSQDDNIILGGRWGACTKGLAQAYAATAGIAYTVDGISLFSSQKESRQLWEKPVLNYGSNSEWCINSAAYNWVAYWEYDLGHLEVGDHLAHLDFWNDHHTHDGADYFGEGKPYKFSDGELTLSLDFIIRVEE